jgi:hypothetical protein
MSVMFEVLYKSPSDPRREGIISERASQFGGRLTFREEPDELGVGPVCLTYEFNDFQRAAAAAFQLRSQGEHVEGPMAYGGPV